MDKNLVPPVGECAMVDDLHNTHRWPQCRLTDTLARPLTRRIGRHRERRSGQDVSIGARAERVFHQLAIARLERDKPLCCVRKHNDSRKREERDRPREINADGRRHGAMIRRSKRASRTLRAVVCLSRERRRRLIKRDRKLRSHRFERVAAETQRVERVA